VTVAPNGPASFTGPWIQGDGTVLPVLDFSAGVSLPITVTGGFGCPTGATTATFKAKYAITDTTDATQKITVSAGPVAPTASPTVSPTDEPTVAPTDEPTATPTGQPTVTPTDEPTIVPPTDEPTVEPTETVG